MTHQIDPSVVASQFLSDIRDQLNSLAGRLKLVGFLCSGEDSPSRTYANYTRSGCETVGIDFELREPHKLQLESEIDAANADPSVHGMIVYYPVFGTERDSYIKDLVDHRKDIEGLNSYWARKLYHNQRFVDLGHTKKAILPCTPLAIVKLIEAASPELKAKRKEGLALEGKKVVIFNRSEVVGRPLANMLANDGAFVYSFDLDGPLIFTGGEVQATQISRAKALGSADIVITGVPSRAFEVVQYCEIKPDALCVNFSTLRNFAPDVATQVPMFVPRVGPMTVAMALRNTLRLYDNYHS